MLCAVGDLIEDVVCLLATELHHASDTASRIVRARGGSAANVAAFAALTGSPSRFVGCIGDDDLGRRLCDALAASGVDVRVQTRGRTGSIIVLVHHDGQRSMLTDRGSAADLGPIDPGVLDGIEVLHVPTYSLTNDPTATSTLGLIAEAKRRGILVSIDASSESVLVDFDVDRYRTLIAGIQPDVLLCNEDEARVLDVERTTGLEGAALTVVKHGPQPVVTFADGVRDEFDVALVATVLDSTGAGDAFAAGFLPEYVRSRSLRAAVDAGHRVASRALASAGATLGEQP
jgi:sugar/nucleoside kinase (ribokinase family)